RLVSEVARAHRHRVGEYGRRPGRGPHERDRVGAHVLQRPQRGAADRAGGAGDENGGGHSPRTPLVTAPSPSTSTETVSPSRRKMPLRPPTPAGVPVAMMSPGTSVVVRDSQAIVSTTEKIMSLVLPSWTTSPLMYVRSLR